MRFLIAQCMACGFGPAARLLAASLLALTLAACSGVDEPTAHVAGWTLIDPTQRHPIMVSQRPASLTVRVARGSQGLTRPQKEEILGFLQHFRGVGAGNSRLVIAVPSGSPNEGAAMQAVAELRHMIDHFGFSQSSIVIEPYSAGRDQSAPIRLSYLQFVAEGPECNRWPTNLAEDYRNQPYPIFGCAQQHNLAAQIANPSDLIGPRTMTPSDQERRAVVFDNYAKGKATGAEKSAEERVQVRGAN